MKIERDGIGGFVLHANASELSLINNALNEICNGVDIPQFETRVGAARAEAEALLQAIHDALTKSRMN